MEAVQICLVLFLSWFWVVQCEGEEGALREHNRLRKLHGVPPLTLNEDLSKESEDYAKELAAKDDLLHSKSDGRYGENLCMRTNKPEKCVKDWYNEIIDYDFANPRFTFATGHFTQVVWAASTEMGWGQAKDAKEKIYVVARYTPAGNVKGEFEKNVPQPLYGSAPGQIEVTLNAMTISICFVLLKFTY